MTAVGGGNDPVQQLGKTTFYVHGSKFYSAGKMNPKKADDFINQVAKKQGIALKPTDYSVVRGHVDQTRVNMGAGFSAMGGAFKGFAKSLAGGLKKKLKQNWKMKSRLWARQG